MSRDEEKLERLGREVGSAFSRGCAEERIKGQKSSFLSSLDLARREGPRRRKAAFVVFPVAAAAAVIIVVGVFLLWGSRDRFSGLEHVSLKRDGLWLEALPGEPMSLSFNDGSEVEFSESSSGRVVEASGKKVKIEVKAGKLSASIRKGKGVSWNFSAGEYLVTVKGTVFTMVWDEMKKTLDLRVMEGTVLVTGSGIGAKGILVSAGSRFQADGKTCTVSPGKEAGKDFSGPGSGAVPSPPQEPGETDAMGAEEGEEGLSAPPPALWKDLIEQGRYSQAIALVRKEGLEKTIAGLSLQELWQLADAARYAGDGDAARAVLLAVREKFEKTPKAKIAAFLLGRVAAEIDKKPSEAVSWFKVYLREDPEGPLAEEALGRLVDALSKAGRMKDAASEGKKYLEKYPKGFYAELARSAVEKGGGE